VARSPRPASGLTERRLAALRGRSGGRRIKRTEWLALLAAQFRVPMWHFGWLLSTAAALGLLANHAGAQELFPIQQVSYTQGPVTNTMTISDASGAGETNYPLQLGRPFVEGAIPDAPQILINGAPAVSQADVKDRYPNGSVKFAIMSTVVPSIPANGSVTLSFRDTTANSNAPLTTAQLKAVPNFDAAMNLSFGARLVGPALSAGFPTAITNGGFTLTVNGTAYHVTGINIPAGSSATAALPLVQAAVKTSGAPVVVYAPLTVGTVYLRFIIQTQATGPAAMLGYATAPTTGTDISAMLGLTATTATANSVLAGSNASADLLTMLNAGACQPWTSGPVAQTMVCADDSTAAAYDIGDGDGFKPFRPRFYATFWPQTNQVFVRAIGENDKTTALEDLAYNLTVTGGASAPVTEATEDLTGDQASNPKRDWGLSRWSRTFWFGGTPNPEVNINNNLAYLESTRFIPNYDPAIAVPASAIASEDDYWTAQPHDLYDGTWDGGLWQAAMDTTGARQEIGPYPTWDVLSLYTGDWRMRQMALGMADLAGAFPANLRETDPTKRLSRADAAGLSPETGLGHVVSITDRQTLDTYTIGLLTYNYTTPADAVKIVGPIDVYQPWSFGPSHEPDVFFVPYLLTGDPYYLDGMYLWAGYTAATPNGADTSSPAGRGPSGDYGGINGELRGAAWNSAERAEVAFIAPDSAPEKAYFTYLMNDALATWEGIFAISGTPYDGTAAKLWGASTGDPWTDNFGPVSTKAPTMHNWESNGSPGPNAAANTTILENVNNGIYVSGAVGSETSPWMAWYLQYALGRQAELGFAAKPLQTYTGAYPISLINTSGQPWGIDIYQMPVEQSAGGFLNGWPAVFATLTPQYLSPTGVLVDPATGQPSGRPNGLAAFAGDLGIEGYPLYLLGGMAMLDDAGAPGAAQAWAWMKANVETPAEPALLSAPKWAIVPRTDTNVLPAQPTVTPPG
jgi:hypothetical protein